MRPVHSPDAAFASVTHPNSVTGQTGLLGLDNLFGITDSNETPRERRGFHFYTGNPSYRQWVAHCNYGLLNFL